MAESSKATSSFLGFEKPNTTPVPDQFFDELLPDIDDIAELKVTLYAFRRTFGFKKTNDRISLTQFVQGIVKRDGTVLDKGTGLTRSQVQKGLRLALERGTLLKHLVCPNCDQPVPPEQQESEERNIRGKMVTVMVVPRNCPNCRSRLRGFERADYSIRFRVGSQETYPRSAENLGVGSQQTHTRNSIQETDNNSGVVVNMLRSFKIEQKKAEDLAARYDVPYIREKVALLQAKLAGDAHGRPVDDPAGWLIQAIEKNYQPSQPANRQSKRKRHQPRDYALEEAEPETPLEEATPQSQRVLAEQLKALQQQYGTTQRESKLWTQALKEIEGATTRSTYLSWFPQTRLLSLKDGTAVISVPDAATGDWLAGRLTPVIKRALEGAAGHPIEQLSLQVITPPREKA